MTKTIKVVQIALTSSDSDVYGEYLDDKGRVWYETGKWVYPKGPNADERVWVSEWRLRGLPNEPEEPTNAS